VAGTLTEALERYLEAIYRIQDEKGVARVRDIAAALDVHKSTVTAALRSLADRDMVNYEPYEAVTLTGEGREAGARLAARHFVISRFLRRVLNVDAELAERNACSLEHAMDERVLGRIVCLMAFLETRAAGDGSWIRDFQAFAARSAGLSCEEHIRRYLESVDDR
jgi:DtxR family Mn-dependent transcriptional regulator